MKKFIKSIIFIIIFCILWCIVFKVLWLDKTSIGYFYDEPKNSLDIIQIGGSNVFAHFNTTLAYNLYGFTTGLLATDSQPLSAVKYLIQESEKNQKPKLYVIDIVKVGDDMGNIKDGQERKVIDSMRFSKNRIDTANEMLKYTDVKKENYINYYFSFLLYHNKWKNVNRINIIGNKSLYKGFLFSNLTAIIEPQDTFQWSSNIETELEEENQKVLEDLIDYIKSNNLNVLFVVPRRASFEEKRIGNINKTISIIQDNGLKVLNFNNLEDFEVDFSKDFYNSNHLNIYGSTKYTLYFSKYLKEHYNLPDHREDKSYNSWNTEYERLKRDYNKLTNENFDELLLKYNN